MPWGLKRFQQSRQLHFLTFSCFHRRPNFASPPSQTTFESSLERVRQQYGLLVYGYVVIPEHFHLLISEPEKGTPSTVMQALKLGFARRMLAGMARAQVSKGEAVTKLESFVAGCAQAQGDTQHLAIQTARF